MQQAYNNMYTRLSQGCHQLAIFTCVGVYVHMCTCAHSTDRPLKKKKPLMWWTTHQAAYTHVAALARKYLAIPASSAPSERVFSTTKKKKRWRISSPSLIFTTQSCNFSRLMRPFVSHKFHHKRSILTIRLFLVYAWSVRACTLYGSKKPCIHTASYICLQQIQLQCNHL